MNGTQPETLLDVVDELTRPKFEQVAQLQDGKWAVRNVQVPALLELMRDAVTPSGEGNGGSGASKSTRAPVDLEALFEFAKMTSTAAGWAHGAGVRPTREPATDLRAWYSATLGDNTRNDDWYRRHITRWVVIIRNKLVPPKSFEAKYPCPVCGTVGWGDQFNGGGSWPIEVRYRLDDDERMRDEVARCRAPQCGVVWYGHDAVVELAEEATEKFGQHAGETTAV
jgi:hypothetical protein